MITLEQIRMTSIIMERLERSGIKSHGIDAIKRGARRGGCWEKALGERRRRKEAGGRKLHGRHRQQLDSSRVLNQSRWALVTGNAIDMIFDNVTTANTKFGDETFIDKPFSKPERYVCSTYLSPMLQVTLRLDDMGNLDKTVV